MHAMFRDDFYEFVDYVAICIILHIEIFFEKYFLLCFNFYFCP